MATIRERKPGVWEVRVFVGEDEVRAVIAAADRLDPAARLALRLAAVTGACRAEL